MTDVMRNLMARSTERITTSIVWPFSFIPYWLIGLTARVALAKIFWSSAQTHLASWQTTLYMFANTYKVPVLPPTTAAYITIVIELVAPSLFILGLATRFAALVTFCMMLVIEIFVFPQAWPTHIQWAAMMLMLMAGGAGGFSVDALVQRWLRGHTSQAGSESAP